ncbi:D-alanyl-D-alanine carboxypeptidase/D-alanyl-D-alanine endopeptidase [Agarivorans sp. QJM3NY_25]|uniref:D-alanyl-D-alanine carboxypeptidase/D-alanyl-D-alanine endopeptidase n=1 Tax=Agarivorans sp. QJM3NY_25 TaxID=3421430 RepID=UPI003D7EBB25
MRFFPLLVISLLLVCGLSQAETKPLRGATLSYIGPVSQANSQQLLVPASTLKIVTATAAMKILGADFRFNTQLSIKLSEQGLDLHLHMSGDPSLSSKDLNALLTRAFSRYGKKIHSITIDDGVFSGHNRSRGQVWNDIGICFASPVSALNIDGNCINGNLKPGKIGQLSDLHISDPSLLNMDNQIMTVAADTADCEQRLVVKDHNHYQLSGCIPKNAKMMPLRFSITDEHRYFSLKLGRVLAQLGAKYSGQIQYRSRLAPFPTVFTHQSVPLIDLLKFMLVESDNLTADSIFKSLAAAQGRKASYAVASKIVLAQLTALGLDVSQVVMRDGSGLSRENLISAELLYQLLQRWQTDPQLQVLPSILAIAGENGTLKYRRSVTKSPLKHHIHAKSGYVTGVMNLVGFIEKQGHLSPFVFMSNGVALNEQQRQAVKERRVVHPILVYERDWLEKQWQALN